MFVGEALIQVGRMMIGEVEAEGCSIEIMRAKACHKSEKDWFCRLKRRS
jgi:hypothetical protein